MAVVKHTLKGIVGKLSDLEDEKRRFMMKITVKRGDFHSRIDENIVYSIVNLNHWAFLCSCC